MKNNCIKKTAAVFTTTALLAAGALKAGADDEKRDMVDDLIDNIWYGEWTEYVPEDEPEPDSTEAELPSRFDLRDVDGVCYVPEIRSQDPYGTCWSFGAVAAAEISIAYQLGVDFNTADDVAKEALDLSEKHLAWFSYTPLPEDSPFYSSQSGEGYHYKEYDNGIDTDEETHIPYDFGGYAHYAAVLFSEGVGPAFEFDVPYINNDGKWNAYMYSITVDDDYNEEYGEYYSGGTAGDPESVQAFIESYPGYVPGMRDYVTEYDGPGDYYMLNISRLADGDWSVDESERFSSIFLKNSNILPVPASTDGNSEYRYDEKATLAIKKELYAGKGVAITMYSDHSMPGYTDDFNNAFLSFRTSDGKPAESMEDADIWAHYTYCSGYDRNDPFSGNYCMGSNHVVCIVGYDDDFPKEYFNDPNGTIGGNGAWIVRNSWGSRDNSDITARYDWGNNGDGYFYLSYYDQSIDSAESYEFELFGPEDEGRGLELYDLFPEFGYQVSLSDAPVYMANVFTAEDDEIIRDIGIMTALPDLTAKISVYLLNEDFTSPTDGKRVSGTEETFEYMGYHMTRLDDEISIDEGQKYSVVLELLRGDGKYVFEINAAENEEGHDSNEEWRKEFYINEYGSLEGYRDEDPTYGKMVVNAGESWIGAGDGTSADWRDLVKVIDKFDEMNTEFIGGAYYDYDNFPIRSYPYASVLEVKNSVVNEKKVYDAGDVIEGIVTIDNFAALESYEDIELQCSLVDFGDDAVIPILKPGDRAEIEYSYTVTEEDLGKGTLTSEIEVYICGERAYLNEKFSTLSFTVKTADKKPEITTPAVTAESVSDDVSPETPAPVNEPQAVTAAFPLLPIIIIGAAVLIAAGVVTVIIVVRKRNVRK